MRLDKLVLIFIAVSLLSCKKDKEEDPIVSTNLSNGMVVLCEGLFQQNNSSLSWVDLSSGAVQNSFFLNKTGRLLGDTGNDLQKYGSKIYIVVNVSSTIEVLSASNFESIKQIEMTNGQVSKQPRSMAFANGKVFVSCYDGYVDVIDTTSLTVTNRIQVGQNPEGVTYANGNIYVANSGGLNFPNVDSTLSVIDVNSEIELMKITVGPNPGAVIADAFGDVYVISRGNYGTIPSRLKRINTATNTMDETFNFDVNGISKMNNNFLIHDGTTVSIFNPNTESIENSNLVNTSGVTTLYHIQYSASRDRIYLLDAMNYTSLGFVRVFNSDGSYVSSYEVGLNPSKIIFYD